MYINDTPGNVIIEVSPLPPDDFNVRYRLFKSNYDEDREDFIINMSWEEFRVIENVIKERIKREELNKKIYNIMSMAMSED